MLPIKYICVQQHIEIVLLIKNIQPMCVIVVCFKRL